MGDPMFIPERYCVRMLNIPNTMTQRTFEIMLLQRSMKFLKVFFATHDGNTSAGFAFIEFKSRDEMELFKTHFTNINDDVLYNDGRL